MNIRCVILVASATFGQRLESRDKTCDSGFACRSFHHCPLYQEQVGHLSELRAGGVEYEKLICNKAEKGICCEETFEIVNGQVVEKVEDMPFIARIHIKDGPFTSSFCGATIIARQFLLTAKHCLTKFWEYCIEERDCVAHFRDLVRGRDNHEKGQFYIPLVDVFARPGRSDLAVVKLKHGFEEHEDYELGAKLIPIKLAEEPPKSGEVVMSTKFKTSNFEKIFLFLSGCSHWWLGTPWI